jgi:hypothetical protein
VPLTGHGGHYLACAIVRLSFELQAFLCISIFALPLVPNRLEHGIWLYIQLLDLESFFFFGVCVSD